MNIYACIKTLMNSYSYDCGKYGGQNMQKSNEYVLCWQDTCI